MKKVRRCLGVIGLVSFFCAVGTVGSMELGSVSMIDGIVQVVVYLILLWLSVVVGNELVRMEQIRQSEKSSKMAV